MRDNLEQRVIADFDGSDASWETANLAAAEAHLRHRPLQLIGAAAEGRSSADLRPHLAAVVRRLRHRWPDVAVAARVVDGDVTEALLDESRHAALVAVGRDTVDGRHVQVAAHALCPTVVVSLAGSQTPDGPVLVGVDISPHAEPALGFAFEEAAVRAVPLLAVHVWSGIPAPR